MKSKRMITGTFCVVFFLFAETIMGCAFFDDSVTVTVKNDTGNPLTITKLSTESDPSLPVTIAAGESKTLELEYTGAEGVYFTVEYDGTEYTGDTGYVQEATSYTVNFLLSEGKIASQTVLKSFPDNDDIVPLTKVGAE